MQPILPSQSHATTASAVAVGSGTRSTRRAAAAINYTDPGSGDEFPEAGAIDSDDSEFQASGGTRTQLRQGSGNTRRLLPGTSTLNFNASASPAPQAQAQPSELDKSYLGLIPPESLIRPRPMKSTLTSYPYVAFVFPYPRELLLTHLMQYSSAN